MIEYLSLIPFEIPFGWLTYWAYKTFQLIVLIIGMKIFLRIERKSFVYFDKKIYDFPDHTAHVIQRAITYAVYFVVFLVALSVLDLKSLLVTTLAGAGVIGLALGFAAKDVVANAISGIFVTVDKPFKIGDWISVRGLEGTVTDISFRVTTISTPDGKVITIPNQILTQDMVINYSRLKRRRLDIPVGISYDSDLRKAVKLLEEIAEENPAIIAEPEPEVLVRAFGTSSVDLEMKAWVESKSAVERRKLITEITTLIKEKFDAHGIEIAYPHQVIVSKGEMKHPALVKKIKKMQL
ncbi:MAG: mechanosensitive ion channel family protein [archaeon]